MKRLTYLLLTLALLGIEILIALFVNDKIIRPYIGDILVVILMYCFIRIIIPTKVRLLSLYIFIFACFIEFMQYIKIVEILGLSDNKVLSTIIGTSFDWKDILCYGVGCLITAIFQHIIFKNNTQ